MTTDLSNLETIRDLRKQIEGLDRDDENDIVFKDLTASKGYRTLYRMLDGEPVVMTYDLAATAIQRMTSRGPWWTTDPEKAPKFVQGKIPCFLHEDAPEREVLAELGLPPVCEQGKLRNAQARRVHALHCHKDEWAAYQEYLSDEAIKNDNYLRTEQLSATLKLAERASGQTAPTPRIKSTPIDEPEIMRDTLEGAPAVTTACECGWETTKGGQAMAMHKRRWCPLLKGTE